MAVLWAADRFVYGSAALARNFGVHPLVIGLTIVGFGTSAPELLVSGVAAWSGSDSLGIGNAVGSNIANVALVLGTAALVRPLEVHSRVVLAQLPLLLCAMALAALLIWDGTLGRLDGWLLIAVLVVVIAWLAREGRSHQDAGEEVLAAEFEHEVPAGVSNGAAVMWTVVGLLILLVSSRGVVWGAVEVATHFGISELVIGLTVVALGTSLPELAASVMAAWRDEDDIAVGNIVGSNLFNILGVLALPGIIAPGPVEPAVLRRDFPVMFAVSVLFLLFALLGKHRIARAHGTLLVLCFVAYVVGLYVGL